MNSLSPGGRRTGVPAVVILVDAEGGPYLRGPQAAVVAASLATRSVSQVRGQVAQVSSGRSV